MVLKNFLKTAYHWSFTNHKTYSQAGEDRIAEFYLPKTKNGFYVDIGTNDPIHLNNTFLFYKKGWRGICVEPDPNKARLIKLRRRRDEVLPIGAGTQSGNLPFYKFDPDTLSTFSEDESKKYQTLGYKFINTSSVPVLTLIEIFEKHTNGHEIDLLSVDTEGFDLEVLKGNDWTKFRPKIVIAEVVEHQKDFGNRINAEFDSFMTSVGYVKFADTYINSLYMEKEYAKSKKMDLPELAELN